MSMYIISKDKYREYLNLRREDEKARGYDNIITPLISSSIRDVVFVEISNPSKYEISKLPWLKEKQENVYTSHYKEIGESFVKSHKKNNN